MSKKDLENVEPTGQELCEVCGSVKMVEDGKAFCPHCDTAIDYFGEDEDDDDTK